MDPIERLLAQMPKMAEAVNAFSSPEVQQQAFRALMREFRGDRGSPADDDQEELEGSGESDADRPKVKPRRRRAALVDTESKARPRRAASSAPDANLDLRPQGVKSFPDFAAEKLPANDHARSVTAVFWLKYVANYDKVTAAQVAACYLGMGWRQPADMISALRRTASKKRWLVTADSDDLQVPVAGQNFVRHDLPRKPAKT